MKFYYNLKAYIKEEKAKLEELANANILGWGIVKKVLLSDPTMSRKSDVVKYSVTAEVDGLDVDHLGIVGERHYAASRGASLRERELYPKGKVIRQHRHVFAVSDYDCQLLSQYMGVEVTPELLGANLVIDRFDGEDYQLSLLPMNTHLVIGASDSVVKPKDPIAVLRHQLMQQGCGITGNAIANRYDNRELTSRFIKVSKENRGIVLSVEYPVEERARIEPGQKVYFEFPTGISE